MKKSICIIMLLIILFLVGCNVVQQEGKNDISASEDVASAPLSQNIAFSTESGLNFNVSLDLPDEWRLEKREKSDSEWVKYPLADMHSILNIYNDKSENIGAIGYNEYKEYEGAEESPQAIYSGIAIGNNYNFSARSADNDGYYTPVRKTDNGITSTTKVYYAPNISEDVGYGGEVVYNKGILSYNNDLLIYIAVEFDDNSLNDEHLKSIANSITIFETKNDSSEEILYSKNLKDFDEEKSFNKCKTYITVNEVEQEVEVFVPRFMTLKSIDDGSGFDNALNVISCSGLYAIPYSSHIKSDDIDISQALLHAVRRENPDSVIFDEKTKNKMIKYPATDSYAGPSDVGYISKKLVNDFLEVNFSKNMQAKINNDLSFYYCDTENVYSVPWHSVEVQLLPVIFSYDETDFGSEVVFSSVGYMTPGEKMLYYPTQNDTAVIGSFELIKNNNGSYNANPGIYASKIDVLNEIKIKVIKTENGVVIDDITWHS